MQPTTELFEMLITALGEYLAGVDLRDIELA